MYELIESEGVTFAAGVPTVWQMLLNHVKAGGFRFSTLNRTVIGGSACPPAMIHAFQDEFGVSVLHAWGMTEMSPLGTLCTLKNKHQALPRDEQMKVLQKQGRAIYGVDMKIVDSSGAELPWDGKTYGDLLVKGPWIVADVRVQRGHQHQRAAYQLRNTRVVGLNAHGAVVVETHHAIRQQAHAL